EVPVHGRGIRIDKCERSLQLSRNGATVHELGKVKMGLRRLRDELAIRWHHGKGHKHESHNESTHHKKSSMTVRTVQRGLLRDKPNLIMVTEPSSDCNRAVELIMRREQRRLPQQVRLARLLNVVLRPHY